MRTWQTAVIVASGAVIIASQFALAQRAPGLTHETVKAFGTVTPMILLIAVPAALSLWMVRAMSGAAPKAAAIAGIVLTGLAIRAVWFGAPAPVEDDFYRYLWDGAMTANGFNPYTLSPAQIMDGAASGTLPPDLAALARDGAEVLRKVHFGELRTIYPGTAQAAFAAAHLAAPWSLDALRGIFLAADITTTLLLAVLMRHQGINPLWAGLYWCNPFISFTMIGIAHADALIAPLLLGGLLAHIKGRLVFACALLGLAAGVKLWPVLLAPLFLRPMLFDPRRLFPAAAVLGAAAGVTILPLVLSALVAGSGLTAYAGGWFNNNAVFAWSASALGAMLPEPAVQPVLRAALALAAAAVAVAVAVRPAATPQALTGRALAVSAVVFFCSPAQFPWYAVWFLPLAALHRFWPLLAASALLPAYYLFFPFWKTPGYTLFSHGIAFIHALPVLGWLAWRFALKPGLNHPLPSIRSTP